MRLPFEADAADELEAIASWYERQRPGYGALFVSELRVCVERAAQFPKSGMRVSDLDPARDARRFAVNRFPYSVVTAIISGRRAVIAVAHTSRQPSYWRDRLP